VTRLKPLLRAAVIGLIVFGLGWLAFRLRTALTPVLFALLFSYALDPLVERLESARLPRSLAIGVVIFATVFALTLFVVLVLPRVVRDMFELVRTLAEGMGRFVVYFRTWLNTHGIPLPPSIDTALDNWSEHAFNLATGAPMGDMVSVAVSGTVSIIGTLGTFVMVPVFAFYFLHDFNRVMSAIRDLLPLGIRYQVVTMALQVDRVLSDFVRGQLTVMAIMASLYAFGYALIGVPLAVPVGLLAGFLTFVPYLGSAVALVFGVFMVLLHFSGMGQVFAVVAVYIIIQTLDGIIITPRVVGGRLGLSPVWVLFALMAFGQLFGFFGVMLALPASAVMKVFVIEAIQRYRQSELYLGRSSTRLPAVTPSYPPPKPRIARLRSRRGRRDRIRLGVGSKSEPDAHS